MASPTSWCLQRNLGFTFSASGNGFSWPPCRDSPSIHSCGLSDFNYTLTTEEDFKNPFTPVSSTTLKPESHGQCCLLGIETIPFLKLHLPKFYFVLLFRTRKPHRPLAFANCRISWVEFCPGAPFSLLLFEYETSLSVSAQALPPTLHSLVPLFSSNSTFCILLVLLALFHYRPT